MSELPTRTADELARDLRVRAQYLCGASWEVPATVAMMREAADWLAQLAEKDATIAELRQRDKVISRQLERVADGYDPLTKDLRERLEAADATIVRLQDEKESAERGMQQVERILGAERQMWHDALADHARLVERIVTEMRVHEVIAGQCALDTGDEAAGREAERWRAVADALSAGRPK